MSTTEKSPVPTWRIAQAAAIEDKALCIDAALEALRATHGIFIHGTEADEQTVTLMRTYVTEAENFRRMAKKVLDGE